MIFVDSTAIIALAVEKDKFHKEAVDWHLLHPQEVYLSSNFIIIESLSWIRYEYGKKKAVETGWYVLSGRGLVAERVTVDDERATWELFQKADGRGISMVDCTTAVLMKRLKIKDIFTFDQDFKGLGFKVYPS